MYKGTNKIALESQEMIAKAFMNLLEEKSYNKINITELCNKALVSRQTFYSLFDSKENILYYEYQKCALNFSDYFLTEEKVSVDTLVHVFIQYISEYNNFFKILVNNNLTEILGSGISESLNACDKFLVGIDKKKKEYILAFISGALVEMTNKYIKDDQKDDLKMIENLLVELFEGKNSFF